MAQLTDITAGAGEPRHIGQPPAKSTRSGASCGRAKIHRTNLRGGSQENCGRSFGQNDVTGGRTCSQSARLAAEYLSVLGQARTCGRRLRNWSLNSRPSLGPGADDHVVHRVQAMPAGELVIVGQGACVRWPFAPQHIGRSEGPRVKWSPRARAFAEELQVAGMDDVVYSLKTKTLIMGWPSTTSTVRTSTRPLRRGSRKTKEPEATQGPAEFQFDRGFFRGFRGF